jgi:osmoprotectant transport system ATP-binding protein
VKIANTAQAEGASSHSQAATLQFRNVSKTYPGSTEPAIVDLSFEVPAGDICVLVGPSGCGKTTAMRLVNRMIEMTSGDILLDGESVRARPPAELRREIGYAIQQIGLFPHQTIAENIATVPRLLGWSRERIRARIDELIELIGLDPAEMRDRYPAQLSGGQRQRVGVARALAADPPLLLMDEPFGAIDPINRERLQNELLRLQARLRKTIVFVTHDIDEAIKLGDRIAILKQGGVLAQYAAPAELLMAPADAFVEDFVGADRALKRLALQRVADVALRPVDDGLLFALVRDERGAPVAWERDGRRHPVLTVRPADVLRDALSEILTTEVPYAVVVDEDARVTGVLSVEVIHELLVPEARSEAERA